MNPAEPDPHAVTRRPCGSDVDDFCLTLSLRQPSMLSIFDRFDEFRKTCYRQGMITPAQCRAARGLIRWTQDDLAAATGGVGVVTIRQFETEKSQPRTITLSAIQRALEGAGVRFLGATGVELTAPGMAGLIR